jgi:hypothetical protein
VGTCFERLINEDKSIPEKNLNNKAIPRLSGAINTKTDLWVLEKLLFGHHLTSL